MILNEIGPSCVVGQKCIYYGELKCHRHIFVVEGQENSEGHQDHVSGIQPSIR